MRANGFVRLVTLLMVAGLCRLALAHPMGNFSVNHYSKITLENDRIRVRYLIDLAEIPTYQELQRANISTSSIDPNSVAAINYVAIRGAELGHGLAVNVDGQLVPLRMVSSGVIFPPGAGGLPTMKMGFVYEAAYPPGMDREHATLHYADENYAGHAGWKEIVASTSAGSLLRSSVPATDRSGELSNYPTDLLTSPPQDLEASLVAALPIPPPQTAVTFATRLPQPASAHPATATRAVGHQTGRTASAAGKTLMRRVSGPVESSQLASAAAASMQLQANRQLTPRSRFTELIQEQHLSAWFLFTAALIAIGLGGP